VIYLDHNATTPLDPRVLDTMLPYLTERFGNAASPHAMGVEAADAVERARVRLAAALGADPREIVWTSGATEADNLALKGVAAAPIYARRRHLVTVRTEHKAVLDPCLELERGGLRVTRLPVDRQGMLDLERLRDALTEDTLLVSVMAANNETGVLHPIEEIGALCRARGVLFHCDATQAIGREPIDVERCKVDLLSLSAHKFHGPKGVGALYLRRRRPRVRCEPLFHGGGHERGLRSGTLDVAGIVGLGSAVELAVAEMEGERCRQLRLRDVLERGLLERAPSATVNGHPFRRLANTLNISFPGVDAEELLRAMPDLAASTAAACTSASRQPSYVLRAMSASSEQIRGSVRFSLGRFTREEEIDEALETVDAALGATGRRKESAESAPGRGERRDA